MVRSNESVTLDDMIDKFLLHHIQSQNSDGSFPSGMNGVYGDPETPVRNTAHFLYLLSNTYKKNENERIKDSAYKAISFLMSELARPHGFTFHCRKKTGKDKCNGLVGQAWAIESLIEASSAFNRLDCYDLAEKVFLLHPWHAATGLWQRVEIDGETLSYDSTFNHQLWFASVASKLVATPEAQRRSLIFLKKVAARPSLYSDGTIFHDSLMGRSVNYLSLGLKPFFSQLKRSYAVDTRKNQLYLKSVGYHAFNLHAYAVLKEQFPENEFWKSKVIKKITVVTCTEQFRKALDESEFGYYYNISGFELSFALAVLSPDSFDLKEWVDIQFEKTFLDDVNPLSNGAKDLNTAVARFYEVAYLDF